MDCGSLNTILKILKQAMPHLSIPLMPEYVISRIVAKVSQLILNRFWLQGIITKLLFAKPLFKSISFKNNLLTAPVLSAMIFNSK